MKKKSEDTVIKTENNTEKELDLLEQKNKIITKSRITLQELRNEIQRGIVSGQEIPIVDKVILDNSKEKEAKNNIVKLQTNEVNSIIEKMKYQTSSEVEKKSEKDYSHLMYPYRIRIPKDKWKYGYTYKVNDCFYDSDGTFLYRVPGMY